MPKDKDKINRNTKKRTGHVVSHTHWDREWRYTIWETKFMLITFMDELIELLENGIYSGFLMDGQVIPVLDYLEYRPEMKERIQALVKIGKLQVGPWLTLPDEYPIDGEALVRNLLLGNRYSKELGKSFNAGYTSFGWGQTAQLPQIYAGFGMDVAMIGKKVSSKRAPQCEFLWRAPDGSELLTTRFGQGGRQNFFLKLHLSSLFGIDHESSDWKYGKNIEGLLYHRADRGKMEQDHFMLTTPENWHPEIITQELLEHTWKTTDESVLENDRLMMNGCDYAAAQPIFEKILRRINEVDCEQNRQWIQTTMSDFIDLMRKKIDRNKLNVVNGELRDGCCGAVTGNALTTRLYLKILNKIAQKNLIHLAEPLSVLSSLIGAEYQEKMIKKAWLFLLEAHPHDSVNGVTQDQTVIDVSSRLYNVIGITDAVIDNNLKELIKRINIDSVEDDDAIIVVYNPLPYPRKEILETWVTVPVPKVEDTRFEAIYGLQVFDTDDKPVSTQWQGCDEESYLVAEIHTRAFPYDTKRHRIFFDTGQVPACGYKVFRASSIEERPEPALVEWSDSKARTSTILVAPNTLENEYLRVDMNPNGTINIFDKKLNKTFSNLNYYEDRGEIGHYWVNKRPMFNQIHTSLGCSANIWSEESGPLRATLVSEIMMSLPAKGVQQQNTRSECKKDMIIKTSFTLAADQHYVEVNIEFDNDHEDHYLRAMFPTEMKNATYADAGGHFNVDHRPIRPQGPTQESVWPDMATLPHINFVDVSDGKKGLAFLNNCLTEYEVLDNDERTMALSLLRAVKNWIITERIGSNFPSQKGGQCFGKHHIRYAIMPHEGDWQQANVPYEAESFNISSIPIQTTKHQGQLPAEQASLFEISNPNIRLSAIKKTEDRETITVRLYNPTDSKQKGVLKFYKSILKAWLTNLNEDRDGEVDINNEHEVEIEIKSNKIATIEIEPLK